MQIKNANDLVNRNHNPNIHKIINAQFTLSEYRKKLICCCLLSSALLSSHALNQNAVITWMWWPWKQRKHIIEDYMNLILNKDKTTFCVPWCASSSQSSQFLNLCSMSEICWSLTGSVAFLALGLMISKMLSHIYYNLI